MYTKELENRFIAYFIKRFDTWKYTERHRSFSKQVNDTTRWHLHITVVQRGGYFEASADVSVEFLNGKKRVCIIGAQLYNIDKSGYKSFPVKGCFSSKVSAYRLTRYFHKVGEPFLERYSDPNLVLNTLKLGGREADLLMPIHDAQADVIKNLECFIKETYGI